MSELHDLVTDLSPEKRKLLEMLLKEEGVDVSDLPIAPRPTDTTSLPLSFAQERLWFLDQFELGTTVYNVPTPARLTGPLDVVVLERSLNAIITRHEALRTTFVSTDGKPMQHIAPALTLPLPMLDLRALPKAERELEVQRHATAEAQKPFDLEQGPLIRARLLQLDEEEHVILLTMHHIVSDGLSVAVFNRELSAFYNAFVNDKPVSLPALPIQYADFAIWQRQWLQGQTLDQHLSYWTQQLTDLPVLELPTDRPRPAVQTYQGATYTFECSKSLTEALKAVSQQEEATLFMTLLTAFKVLLHRYTGQDNIVVGTAVANRNRGEIEGLIGFFVNTLVLRTDCLGHANFLELLNRVREVTLDAYAHDDLPFEKIVDALQPERDLSHQVLFQVMFVLQDATTVVLESPNLSNTPVLFDSGASMFDLTLFMKETDQGLVGKFEYATALFETSTITRMVGHLQAVLQAIAADPNQCISDLPLLTEEERRQLLVVWNATQIQYPKTASLPFLFEQVVERCPEAEAVILGDRRATYRELRCRSDQLAAYLHASGISNGALVGVSMDRSVEMVWVLLGILKSGAAYLPLDPHYPTERLVFMVEDSGVSLVISEEKYRNSLPAWKPLLLVDQQLGEIEQYADPSPGTEVDGGDLAYVIYTSGSTGKPKGVQIQHRSVVNFLKSMQQEPGLSEDDVLLSVTTLSFDISVLEIFLPLVTGAKLVLVSRETAVDGKKLLHVLKESQATLMQATPSTWRLLIEGGWTEPLKLKMLCGGEAFSPELANQLLERGTSLWNMYGPTETTIWSTVHRIEKGEGPILIGRPIANTQLYILDQQLQPAPIGVHGELYIGGDGLARGYLNRPELTAERFIRNPFSDEPGARLYKTGDLARYLPDGNIECLGRLDHQVKIRGFRIELGEIEAVLDQHPAVREAVVLAREEVAGDKRLVAYVVPARDTALDLSALRRVLRNQLPEYMLPAAFVILDTFPLTPNGKVDSRALPAPEQTRPVLEEAFVAPRNRAEESLAEIWRRVIGVESVGVHDNFFALGGHSLLAIQMLSRVRDAFEVEIAVATFFAHPTVAGLAEVLGQQQMGQVEAAELARLLAEMEELSLDETRAQLRDS